MKKIGFYILVCAAVMSACSLKDKTDYTPAIAVSDYFYLISDTSLFPIDSLRFGYDATQECYRTDTAAINDTIQFAVGLYGFANSLTSFTMRWNPELVKFLVMENVYTDDVFKQITLYDDGSIDFVFQPGYLSFGLPIQYTTIAAGNCQFEIILNSDSKYSPVQCSFFAPCQ